MHRLLDQAARQMWTHDVPALPGARSGGFHLSVDESDEGYVLRGDLPGFDADDVRVAFDDGILTIEAKHEDEQEFGAGWTRRSLHVVESISLDEAVEEDDMRATYNNGVLEIHVPVIGREEDEDGSREIEIEFE